MKNDRLDRALNFLDDDLISEAADYKPRKKAKPVRIIKYSAAAACLFAVIGGAFAVKAALRHNNDNVASLVNPADSTDFISSVISSLESTTPSSDSVPQNSEQTFSTSTESNTSPSTTDTDNIPENPTISEMLNDPDIVWDKDATKGNPEDDILKLGETKITNRLSNLMNENPGAVFAVKVNFENCLNVIERDNWKYYSSDYGECTIGELRNKYMELGNRLKMDDGLSADDELKLAPLRETLWDALYTYYADKFVSFMDTFNVNDIGIYPVTEPALMGKDGYSYFICFATAEQLGNFKCKENEAFIFDTIPQWQAEAEYN